MNKTITINESHLKTIISEALKRVLYENVSEGTDIVSEYERCAESIISYANEIKNIGVLCNELITDLKDNFEYNGINVISIQQEIDNSDDLIVLMSVSDLTQVQIPEEYEENDISKSINNILWDISRDTLANNRARYYVDWVESEVVNPNTIKVTISFNEKYKISNIENLGV